MILNQLTINVARNEQFWFTIGKHYKKIKDIAATF